MSNLVLPFTCEKLLKPKICLVLSLMQTLLHITNEFKWFYNKQSAFEVPSYKGLNLSKGGGEIEKK